MHAAAPKPISPHFLVCKVGVCAQGLGKLTQLAGAELARRHQLRPVAAILQGGPPAESAIAPSVESPCPLCPGPRLHLLQPFQVPLPWSSSGILLHFLKGNMGW